MSQMVFFLLVGAVAVSRLLELLLSRHNRQQLAAKGAVRIQDRHFSLMVLLHAGVFAGAVSEVAVLRRPFLPAIAVPAVTLFSAGVALRIWVISTLGHHWNAQVMDSTSLGVVTRGPYRWVRHPNYLAVFIELLALPMIHTAWLTAASAAIAHVLILRQRIVVEESVLLRSSTYRKAMGTKARFFPGLF